jgi:collagen type III alpha
MQLQPGGALQVTGEDEYLDVLAPLVVETGQAAVLATLHEVTEQKARSAKQALEVRIDDQPVGRLTAAMSEHLMAAVRQADRSGVVLYVRARVHGSALKAEVTIYPTKVADLPQA